MGENGPRMGPLVLGALILAGAIAVILAVALAGRALRGAWWDAGKPEDEDEELATGFPTHRERQRWDL